MTTRRLLSSRASLVGLGRGVPRRDDGDATAAGDARSTTQVRASIRVGALCRFCRSTRRTQRWSISAITVL